MKFFVGLFLAASLATGYAAISTNTLVTFSHSRQFVVQGPRLPGTRGTLDRTLLSLEPSTTAVSAERIKQALLQVLNLPDRWQGKIRVSIQPSKPASQAIDIQAVFYLEGWQYWVVLPEQVDRLKFMRAIVNVLLLEIANRQATEKSAEIPLWMMEGMTGYLQSVTSQDLVLQPYSRMVVKETIPDPAWRLRTQLGLRPPLSFTQLSLPTPEMVEGDAWEVFQICAQLFFVELLRLDQGPRRLLECLWLLPQYQNWQMAFLQAYRPLFASLLEVEKWWSLVLSGNELRELPNAWSAPATLEKMTDVLRFPVWQHDDSETHAAATPSSVKLQEFIQLWDPEIQKERLQQATDQLAVLKGKAAPEFVPLIEGYRDALSDYLLAQDRAEWKKQSHLRINHEPEPPLEKAIKRLDGLDRRREILGQQHSGRP